VYIWNCKRLDLRCFQQDFPLAFTHSCATYFEVADRMKFFFLRKSNVGYLRRAAARTSETKSRRNRTGQVGRRDDGADNEEAERNEQRATSMYIGARKNTMRKNTTGSRTGRDPRPRVTPLSRRESNKTLRWLEVNCCRWSNSCYHWSWNKLKLGAQLSMLGSIAESRWDSDLIGKTVNKGIYTSAFLLHSKNYVKY